MDTWIAHPGWKVVAVTHQYRPALKVTHFGWFIGYASSVDQLKELLDEGVFERLEEVH